MSLNLSSFVKSLLPSFTKSDVEEDMEISLEHIPVIIESYTRLAESSKVDNRSKFKNKEVSKLVDTFYKELNSSKIKVRLRKNNLAVDTVTLFSNFQVNGEWLLKEISDALNDTIMSSSLTTYNANLMRTVPFFYFATRYALDFLNYIYVKETEEAGLEVDEDFRLVKKQEEFITKNIKHYAKIVAKFGNSHEEFVDEFDKIVRYVLPQDKVEELVHQYKGDKIDIFDNLPQGFVGSPIYSVRLMFATWSADRLRNMKDKKKLLELRYLHHKLLKENGNSDLATEKEINYLQKRIGDLDYKISRIEEGL